MKTYFKYFWTSDIVRVVYTFLIPIFGLVFLLLNSNPIIGWVGFIVFMIIEAALFIEAYIDFKKDQKETKV